MSSNINNIAANIDANFPVAGQDNSSQGFRDNFSAIKLAFSTATSEISDLQINAVRIDQVNDFQFVGVIKGVTIQNSGEEVLLDATNNLDFRLGGYQKSVPTTSTTYQVSNWPTGIYSKMRLEVSPSVPGVPVNVNFLAPAGTIRTDSSNIASLPVSVTTSTLFDVWTVDTGVNVFLQKVGTYS